MRTRMQVHAAALLAACGLCVGPAGNTAAQYSAGPGDTITFKAKNRADSAADLEGVSTPVLSYPSFLTLTRSFPSRISKGGEGRMCFVVNQGAPRGSGGTLRFTMTHNMQTEGLWALPATWSASRSWSGGPGPAGITLETPDDVENPDPTYIQLSRRGTDVGRYLRFSRFSPGASPGSGDTAEVNYYLGVDAYVTITIYDEDKRIVRRLLTLAPREGGQSSGDWWITDYWDGRNDEGVLCGEGVYTYGLMWTGIIHGDVHGSSSARYTIGTILLDNTPPTAAIAYVKAHTPAYGDFTVIGTAGDSDVHFESYTLTVTNGAGPFIALTNSVAVQDGVLGILPGHLMSNGCYVVELSAMDRAGNTSVTSLPLVVRSPTNALVIHINAVEQDFRAEFEGYSSISDRPDAWVDDDLPAGSTPLGTWEWDTNVAYSGAASHTDPAADGTHGHYFIHADEALEKESRHDQLIQYVYLDPVHRPDQIMVQFYTDDGDGEHRAFWGVDAIPSGAEVGTAGARWFGFLPVAGQWVRLKIPFPDVGLEGKPIRGMAFVVHNGRAYWDKTTLSNSHGDWQETSWQPALELTDVHKTETLIEYTLSRSGHVLCTVCDSSNAVVRTLIDAVRPAGENQILWDGKDESGVSVSAGAYAVHFGSRDGPVDSNAYAPVPVAGLAAAVPAYTSATDSAGNRYDIEDAAVRKYDPTNALLLSIDAGSLGRTNFHPLALVLDANDNLVIADGAAQSLFKVDSAGYYVVELPYPAGTPWADPALSFNSLSGLGVATNGDLRVADLGGASTQQLVAGRCVIEIEHIKAELRAPYEDCLLYDAIPVMGSAFAREFDRYTVEYGAGHSPSNWTTIVTSYDEAYDDRRPFPPAITIFGNLATWRTRNLPKGPYTLRLTVYDRHGSSRQDAVHVNVAALVSRWPGNAAIGYEHVSPVESPDGLVCFEVDRFGLDGGYELFMVMPVDPADAPPVDDPELTLVGKVYEIRPPDLGSASGGILSMRWTPEALAEAGVTNTATLKMYRWNPLIGEWIFQRYSGLTQWHSDRYYFGGLHLRALISRTGLTPYATYFAVISDPPPAPALFEPLSPTIFRTITVMGEASPSVRVRVLVDGVAQGEVHADENSGQFAVPGVQLQVGTNVLTAVAFDAAGNTSPTSSPAVVELVFTHPTAVASVGFRTSDFSAPLGEQPTLGDWLYIELTGTDANPSGIDATTVTLMSSLTDPTGILVELLETGTNSGVYRGVARVGEASDAAVGVIGVSVSAVETITVTSDAAPAVQHAVDTVDRVPPPAPAVSCPTHRSLCQDTFEIDLGQWTNMSGSHGATVARSTNSTSSGLWAARMLNAEEGGDFGCFVRTNAFDAAEHPVIAFDYKLAPEVRLNLVAYVNGMWKEIVFTDEPKTVDTFDEDLYRTIGTIEGVTADGAWHHAEFNLHTMLQSDDPAQTNYVVQNLFFADYNLPRWMELVRGDANPSGTTWYADNLVITEAGSSNNAATFVWAPGDGSVTDYSYVLDQSPGTVPDEVSEGSATSAVYTSVADGTWFFHARAHDAGDNWGPANHYRIKIDTTGPTADSPEPADDSSSGSLQVKVRITDGDGSGVDAASVQLEVDGTVYDMASGGLTYDAASGILTFSLWKVSPVQDPWVDGETIQARLIVARDLAGNPLQAPLAWSWTVDYSDLAGGHLSLLTTGGGHTPSWSRDGNRLAFMSERGDSEDIWIIDADNYAELRGTATQLTTNAAKDHHPAWSPIDDRIAFVSDRDGTNHIYVVGADGSGLRRITDSYEDDSHPTWSPDGSKVGFSRGGEIWVVDADGTDAAPVTTNSVVYCLDPAWSPDGSNIAFTMSLYIDQVGLVATNGTQRRVVTESGRDSLPAWSRSTGKLVYVSERDDQPAELWNVNPDGSRDSVHIENDGLWWDSEPAPSPTDARLAFQSTRNGVWNIWVQTEVQLDELVPSPPAFSPNGDGFLDTTDIGFTVDGGVAFFSLNVYDASSNLIRSLVREELPALGQNAVPWDGTDALGAVVADETYHCQVRVEGSSGASALARSTPVTVDTQPPLFTNWQVSASTTGPKDVSVTLVDRSGIDLSAVRLQYGVAGRQGLTRPDLVGWTDITNGLAGSVALSWSHYFGKWLYLRCFAQDVVGNAAYSSAYEMLIGSDSDTDADGMPDEWERRFFAALEVATTTSDWDGDGSRDWQECLAGTDPTNVLSALRLISVQVGTGTTVVLRWLSVSNRFYSLERSTNLPTGFAPVATGIRATPAQNVHTDTVSRPAPAFYRISLED